MRADVKAAYEPNGRFVYQIRAAEEQALGAAVIKACERLNKSGRLPYRTGRLSVSTTVDISEVKAKRRAIIVSSTPYAARLYFHPEYKFGKRVNRNAGGRWFDTFIGGEERGFIERAYAAELRALLR